MKTRYLRLARWAGLSLLLLSCAPTAAPLATAKPAAPTAAAAAAPTAGPTTVAKPTQAAAEGPRYGGVLNIAHMADPKSFDPIQENTLYELSPVAPNYSGIVQFDPLDPAKVVGDLAEKWDASSDGLTYTFQLFKGVKWHDGTPFSAEDARFALNIFRQPPSGINSPRREWLKAVSKIEAPDKDTLVVTLGQTSASFLANLGDGRTLIVPKHVFEAKGSMKRDIVGTGPYRFKSQNLGASFSVQRNQDYFIKGRPYLDGITWYVVTDSGTRLAALRTRRVHATPWGPQGLKPSQADILQRDMSGKVRVDTYPALSFSAFWMPLSKRPWSDIRVRRAVHLTIDRQSIIKTAAEGVGDLAAFLPSGVWGLPQAELLTVPGYRQPKSADIAEAKKLMVDAGYPNGFKTTTIVSTSSPYSPTAVVVREQLAQIGVEVSVEPSPLARVQDLTYSRAFDSAVMSGSGAYDDPDQILGAHFVTGVPRNYSEFSDATVDKLYDEQSRTVDLAKRKQLVQELQRKMFDLLPNAPIVWQLAQFGVWNEVKDLKAGIGMYNNLKFQNVWMAQ